MSKGTYPLKRPRSVKRAAERRAQQDGVSLNQRISVAVAPKAGSVETAALLPRRRAGCAKVQDLRGYLAAAPHAPPMPGDEITA